ncbi:UDP-N-acetylglucosamine 2-epimerase [Vampirovibrio chlorellavorus]|uniref:UDP-N-acetylglucosamine 2-epimerase n=1 Tax=Vampirovibrio chlorellavorus TaxID=758823 RepID=UPI0026EEA020|nr:UDP-N-acetylglucosamine 2-epimerase [Vampirovibrio chlorellavorus]
MAISLKVGIFTGTRAEYGLMYPIAKRLQQDERFEVCLYVSGSHLDDRYGQTLKEIEQDGFSVTFKPSLPQLGQNMAADCGFLTQTMGEYFGIAANRPNWLLVLGDRYETMGAALAAFLSNIPLAHVHGGDVVRGGMLDDPIRHAITKLAHLHFPATPASAQRILAMGEEPWRVTVAGSPVLDNIRLIPKLEKAELAEKYNLDMNKPWVLFTQHPITTQATLAGQQARQTLSALCQLGDRVQIIATYPNHDEGSEQIIEALETDYRHLPQFRVVQSLGRVNYLNMLRYVSLVVGNSSSGLLETAHFKVPCLNIGERQKGRERGENVLDVAQEDAAIQQGLAAVLWAPHTLPDLNMDSHPFGEGQCAERVREVLASTPIDARLLQKQLTY